MNSVSFEILLSIVFERLIGLSQILCIHTAQYSGCLSLLSIRYRDMQTITIKLSRVRAIIVKVPDMQTTNHAYNQYETITVLFENDSWPVVMDQLMSSSGADGQTSGEEEAGTMVVVPVDGISTGGAGSEGEAITVVVVPIDGITVQSVM